MKNCHKYYDAPKFLPNDIVLYYSPAVGNAIISTVISVHWSTLDDSWMYRINWSTDSMEESELQSYQRGVLVPKNP